MATLKYEGNATFQSGTLTSAYTSGGGTLSLTSGHGDRFPTTGDFWVRVDSEVFKCTARTGDTLTVTGAQDGTAAANHSAGASVRWVLGKSALDQLRTDILNTSGLVLIEELEASNSASLDFEASISATFDEYLIEILNLLPATNNTNLLVRMSTDGGANYDSGNNYGWAVFVTRAGGTAVAGAESGASSMNLTNYGLSNNASWGGAHGALRLFSPGAAIYKRLMGRILSFGDNGQYHLALNCTGSYQSTTAVNAFRFLMASGNITSGKIRVYGVKKT